MTARDSASRPAGTYEDPAGMIGEWLALVEKELARARRLPPAKRRLKARGAWLMLVLEESGPAFDLFPTLDEDNGALAARWQRVKDEARSAM